MLFWQMFPRRFRERLGMAPPNDNPYEYGQQYGWSQQSGGSQHQDGAGAPPPQPPGPGRSQPMDWAGAFNGLFDFGFSEFITAKVIRILYILGMVLIGLLTLGNLVSSIATMASGLSAFTGVLWFLLTPVIAVVATILLRVGLELLIVVFRISDDLSALRRRNGV